MMRSDLIVYVDFDSTLFNTHDFSSQLRGHMAARTGLSAKEIASDGRAYFFDPYYDFEKHTAKYGLDSAEMWHMLEATCRTDFLYPDSADFIKAMRTDGFDPKILSFGEHRFQSVKIKAMMPFLTGDDDNLEIIIVDKKKNEHIAALHNGQRGVLIDDVPDQDLPTGFTEIHLDRSQELPAPVIRGNVVRVSSLAQAREIIVGLQ
jgi:hypothetical protein